MTTKRKLAQWLYVVSGVVHAALYPLALIAIVIGFWMNGLRGGLVTMLFVIIGFIGLRFVILAIFGELITLLDPSFFH